MEEITRKLHVLRQVYLPSEAAMDAASEKRLNLVLHLIFLHTVVCCVLAWATAAGHIPWEAAFLLIAVCLIVLLLAVNGLAILTYRQGQQGIFYQEMEVLADLLKAMLLQTSVFMNLALPRDAHVSLLNLRQDLHSVVIALDAIHPHDEEKGQT